jgi:hypothetical protein
MRQHSVTGAVAEGLGPAPLDKEHAEADLVALVRVGARFEKGVLIERPDEHPGQSGGGQQVA